MAKAQDYIGRGGAKMYIGRREHHTFFLDWVNNWCGGGGHRTYFVGWSSRVVLTKNKTTLWLHLASWNLPYSQLS